MNKQTFLGEFEMIVLLAVLRLGAGAYGVTILREIEGRAGRVVSRGAMYVTLDRLEQKGYLSSWLADPTPERGGRAKRYFRVERAGLAALRESRAMISEMWKGLEPVLGKF
jgi:DNA-binding PadR family transcriptional regulator